MSGSLGDRERGSIAFLTFICVVSALGGFLFGYDTVVINGTVIQVSQQFGLGDLLKGLFVSSALWGCVIGSAAAGWLSDLHGRKRTLTVSALLMVISAVGCGAAWSAASLIFFRWIGGLGVGVASMVCPLYISEVSPANLRGRMVTLFQFAITIGIFVAYLANLGWQGIADAGTAGAEGGMLRRMLVDEVWRVMFTAEAIPGLIFLALCFAIPETPRFLAKVGRMPDARAILARVGGAAAADRQMGEIKDALAHEEGRLGELFRPGMRMALFIALFLSIVSEMSGVTVVLYYGTEMLSKADMPVANALGGFAIVGFVNMMFTIIAIWLMDKVGRKPLLFVGTLGCCISLAVIGVLFRNAETSGGLIIMMICFFMACFAFSIGPIKWVIMSEIFPTKIRGRAVAIATLAVWVTDAVYNGVFPKVEAAIGAGNTFFIFAIVLIPQLLFVLFIMPETKGRSLEEIERSWAKS